ncbi:hypothetical protein [uncultured Celeribacter sp.]|uniref:hypothetical protein n=1 Tax=uncultured Celeribacter sp. TaxID=1303376 RepID=UPI002AA62F41|nr:hypothetical protein [uncultured Celeribacter sp.]
MIRVLGFILMLASLPHGVVAEVINVRSGEHAGFSRLVMQFSPDVTWEFGRVDGQYELRTNQKDTTFETSEVFQKIPRSRISDVEVGNGYLRLNTVGRVHADVFELRAGRIVIDIKDGLPEPSSEFEATLKAEISAGNSTFESEPIAENMPAQNESETEDSLFVSEGVDSFSMGPDDFLVEHSPLELPIIMSENTEENSANPSVSGGASDIFDQRMTLKSDRVDELERQLLEQIGRAVSQGLLEPDITQTEKAVEDSRSYQEQAEKTPVLDEPEDPRVEEPIQERSHIRIQSSIDREQNHQPQKNVTDGHGTVCLDNSFVDINNWGAPLQEGLDIAKLRRNTIGEFDLPNPEGIKRLAQYYIYLTFGAEAKSMLRDFGVTVEGHDILYAMADIMDQGYTEAPGRLAHQFGCEGAMAFWSVMAKENLNSWETYNLDSILASFSALPIHLRRHLGPPLSERFIAIDDMQSAKYIQNAILRTDGDHGDAFELLEAELTLADGNLNEAVQQLEGIVHENGGSAAEALVKLIFTKASEGAEIDRKLAENAEAMAVEFRGSSYESTLQNAAIVARIYSGDAEIALRKVLALESDGMLPGGQASTLMSQAIRQLAHEADNTTFAKVLLAHKETIINGDLTDTARFATAERFLDMGFFDLSLEVMAGYSGPSEDETNLLLAKAFLGAGEPEASLRYASQVDSEEAHSLAAKAYFYLNDPESAAAVLREAPSGPERDTFSVLAEDWETLEQSDTATMSDLAGIMKDKTDIKETDTAETPTLSTLEDMLSGSREKRSALEALLN